MFLALAQLTNKAKGVLGSHWLLLFHLTGSSKSSLRRYPTEFIPNSAETTPAASRQVTSLTENTTPRETEEPWQPKVISVTLRGHGGTQAMAPYSINPVQVVGAG